MTRLQRQDANAVTESLLRMERWLLERKTNPQPVATYNVRSRTSGSTAPLWAGGLPVSSQSPSAGIKILRVTATTKRQPDYFGRIITRLDVGTDGNWYRPSQYLAALKASTIGYKVDVRPWIEFGMNRNQKSYLVAITGAVAAQVYLRLWIESNDDIDITVSEIN